MCYDVVKSCGVLRSRSAVFVFERECTKDRRWRELLCQTMTDKEWGIGMTELSKRILAEYQMRKTKAQKQRFMDLVKEYFPEMQVEESGLIRSRNIIIGDVDQAKVVLGAHYDTCAKMPFPNMIAPRNILFTVVYSLLVAVPFLLLMMLCLAFLNSRNDMFLLNYWISFAVMMAVMLYVMMLGKPNEHTANDNTSGVVTLLELLAGLDQEQRSKICVVLFDNEENGLLGSAQFNKNHKETMKDKLLINLDCVSHGDHMLLLRNKPVMERYDDLLRMCFLNTEEMTIHIEKASTTHYPSDQKNFPVHVALSSMKKHKMIGLYMDRIHTKRDVIFEEKNIRYLCHCLERLINEL